MQCYVPATGIVRITDTLKYIPKAYAFPKTTTKYYLQQAIRYIIETMDNHPKTPPFLSYGNATKNLINQISHTLHRSISQSRLKVFPSPSLLTQSQSGNLHFQNIPAYQYQLQEWNRFCNLQGCKQFIQQPHHLQYFSLPHPLALIQIQINWYKNCKIFEVTPVSQIQGNTSGIPASSTQFPPLPWKCRKIPAPKQNTTLSPTISSTYHMFSISTISKVKRRLLII